MSNLTLRIITATVLLLITALAFSFGALGFAILICLFGLAMIYESQSLLFQNKFPAAAIVNGFVFISSTIVLIAEMGDFIELPFKFYAACFFPSFLFLIIALYRKNSSALQEAQAALFQIIYIALPLHALIHIAVSVDFQIAYPVLGCFLCCIWANDIFAYFTGKKFGKKKLFPKHSPNKSWEGLYGGILFSSLTAVAFVYLTDLLIFQGVIIFLSVSVFGNLGDLFESLMKRSAKIKDSSGLLPGHGGFLDRFDSILMAAPPIWLFFALLNL